MNKRLREMLTKFGVSWNAGVNKKHMRNLILIISVGLIIACNSTTYNNKQYNSEINDSFNKKQVELNMTKSDIDYLKIVGDSVIIPAFEIELLLSKKAEEKLKMGNETVVVNAIFYGEPIENLPKKYRDYNDMVIGGLVLLSYRIELTNKRLAKFENLKFSKELYDLLANKNIRLLINICSGRRSTNLNLLNCEILQDSMSNIKGKTFSIKGKLIYNN